MHDSDGRLPCRVAAREPGMGYVAVTPLRPAARLGGGRLPGPSESSPGPDGLAARAYQSEPGPGPGQMANRGIRRPAVSSPPGPASPAGPNTRARPAATRWRTEEMSRGDEQRVILTQHLPARAVLTLKHLPGGVPLSGAHRSPAGPFPPSSPSMRNTSRVAVAGAPPAPPRRPRRRAAAPHPD